MSQVYRRPNLGPRGVNAFQRGNSPSVSLPEASRSPTSVRTLDLRVSAVPESVSIVRRGIDTLGLPEGLRGDAKLLATELVTNSIRHSGLPAGEKIRVSADWSGSRLRFTVRDRPRPAVTGVVGSIRPVPGAESGWGRYLVDRIASPRGTAAGGA